MASIHKIEDIRILTDNIGDSGIEHEITFKPEIFAEILSNDELKVSEPLIIRYELTREGESIHASITLKSQIETQCATCLEQLLIPLDITLITDYLPALDDMTGDLEALRQSSEIGYYRKEIDLGAFIISEMILSLPLRYKCQDNCKGLCPVCGVNLNKESCSCGKTADPRLEKLMTIKKKLRRE